MKLKVKVWNDDKCSFVRANLVELDNGVLVDERGFDLVQFTGLTDKNGVEIYEGDIYFDRGFLSHGYKQEEYCNFRIIQFDNEKVGFNAKTHCGTCFIDSKCVIEGNIYENPELLSATK